MNTLVWGAGVVTVVGTCLLGYHQAKTLAWLLFFFKHNYQNYRPQRPLVCHHWAKDWKLKLGELSQSISYSVDPRETSTLENKIFLYSPVVLIRTKAKHIIYIISLRNYLLVFLKLFFKIVERRVFLLSVCLEVQAHFHGVEWKVVLYYEKMTENSRRAWQHFCVSWLIRKN